MPLRIEIPGGRYHVTARGNDRGLIFCIGRHGDLGWDAAVWLGRHVGRLRLRELAALARDCDNTTTEKAVSRFARRLTPDSHLVRQMKRVQTGLSNFEM